MSPYVIHSAWGEGNEREFPLLFQIRTRTGMGSPETTEAETSSHSTRTSHARRVSLSWFMREAPTISDGPAESGNGGIHCIASSLRRYLPSAEVATRRSSSPEGSTGGFTTA